MAVEKAVVSVAARKKETRGRGRVVDQDIDLNLFKSRFIRYVIFRVMKTKSLASDAPKMKLFAIKLKPNILIMTKIQLNYHALNSSTSTRSK